MTKYISAFVTLFLMVAIVAPLAASAKAERVVKLPKVSADTDVISLGHKKDPKSGEWVEGYAFIHRKDEAAKNGNARAPKVQQCYAFLASGARWKVTEDYLFDPTNASGLDVGVLRSLLASSTDAWDSQMPFEIFGNEIAGVINGAEVTSPDGLNEVYFASIDEANVIAVTTTWGIFGGPTRNRKLVEWDMVFDDADYDWSAEASGVAGKMDFLNIAVHEVGHAAGMGHPASTCSEETMYAYADFAETKKRDLFTGDIAGIKALYK